MLGVVGLVANQSQYQAPPSGILPILVGVLTWLAVLALLTAQLRDAAVHRHRPAAPLPAGRRRGGCRAARCSALLGWKAGGQPGARRRARDSLRLTGVTDPGPPPGTSVGLDGIAAWQTPASRFYRIDTSLARRAIVPRGLVAAHPRHGRPPDTLTFADLLARPRTQLWMTLNCVSNPVGGDLIGNAWWSGVLLKDLLAEAGVQQGADAVKQTSDDGWTCGTPLSALTDDRRRSWRSR